ncbi:hypothetical protein BU23DRAFT_161602 [Bimuria novae-zelandiae CBS 107.79]|uniref:Uncharacterized protein n=1 Tax=Bimuria novae-zelandiae CBS 107.79 TaxID=1447943 RepID=A0A6A5V5B0_9PLEO|nr:hypothetical protein BU23DRAFT_161602 [Bimuria novae-zelandiae CBS 107.79]
MAFGGPLHPSTIWPVLSSRQTTGLQLYTNSVNTPRPHSTTTGHHILPRRISSEILKQSLAMLTSSWILTLRKTPGTSMDISRLSTSSSLSQIQSSATVPSFHAFPADRFPRHAKTLLFLRRCWTAIPKLGLHEQLLPMRALRFAGIACPAKSLILIGSRMCHEAWADF